MGLLDKLTGSSAGQSSEQSVLVSAVVQMLSNRAGGLPGLVQMFTDKGLGDLVSSWVSKGPNLPISADQIQHALGEEQVQQLATEAGMAPEAARSQLAELLPRVIDQFTPEGKIPEGGVLHQALDFLKNKVA